MGGEVLAISPKAPQIPPTMSQRRVEVLAFPNVQLLDVAGPLEVFHAAIGQAARGRAPAPYTIKVIAPEGARISATAGLAFATEPLPDVAEPVDTLIIAGGQGVMQAAANIDIVDWLPPASPWCGGPPAPAPGRPFQAGSGYQGIGHWSRLGRTCAIAPVAGSRTRPSRA